MSKIFISIASYRDPELLPTIKNCIDNAKNPDDLVFCIAWQHSGEDVWDNLNQYKFDKRFHIIDIPYKESKGVCWARSLIQEYYNGEEYYLQLDSHHRFSFHWDTKLKDMLNSLRCKGTYKPILSTYLPSYFPETEPDGRLYDVWALNIDRFLPEGAVFLRPHTLDNWRELKEPAKHKFMSAHFIFTLGYWVKEVPYDANLYFHGEETSLAARSYTWGWDLFCPHQPIIWHEYTRDGKKKQWDDDTKWGERDRASYSRFREYRADFGGASLSSKRQMIQALKALEKVHDTALPEGAAKSFDAFMIRGNRSKLFQLFASHPPIEKRIERLENTLQLQ